MDENELKRKRIEFFAKWGLGFIGCVLIAPLAFMALEGVVALVAFVAIAFASIQFAPVFALKIANARVKALVNEVEKNPIETMQNLYIDRNKELVQADEHIRDFETEIRNFDDQLGGFKQQYPDEADTYQDLSGKMHEALANMKQEQTQARRDLKELDTRIIKAKAIYKMALAAQKVTQLSQSAEAQVFAQIREQVAFDSVRTQLNKSFSSLNLALERRNDAKALNPASTGNVIEGQIVRPRALVEAKRA